MIERPLLTVIVPVQNMAGKLANLSKWLKDEISSEIEVIIVHDKIDNQTEKEISSIVDTSVNSKIIVKTGSWSSPGYARNVGIEIATGFFVAFWDSDDIPEVKSYLEIIKATQREIDIAIGQYKVLDSQNSGSEITRSNDGTLVDVAFNPGIWRFIFKKDFIERIFFEKERMGEDQEFICNCLSRNPKVIISKKVIYSYYVNNPSQLTNNQDAINSLKSLIRRTTNSIDDSEKNYELPIRVMQVRQIITFLKRHPVSGLTLLIKYSIKLISVSRIRGLKVLLKSSKLIMTKHYLERR